MGDSSSDDLPAESTPPEVEQQAERLFALVLAKVEQKIEHQHLPVPLPSAEEAAALKNQAPEVYDLWIRLADKKAQDEAALERLPFEHAFTLSKRAQNFGFLGLLVILGFCGYLASLGGGVQYLAGVIGALDIVAIIGAFRVVSSQKSERD